MRSRLASVFTIVALLGGTGGAIALGQSGSPAGTQHGAATAQYKPSKKKCRKGFHRVGNKCVKNGRKSKAGVRGQNNSRSRQNNSANNGTSKPGSRSGPGFTG
jgi:hypothetical protein